MPQTFHKCHTSSPVLSFQTFHKCQCFRPTSLTVRFMDPVTSGSLLRNHSCFDRMSNQSGCDTINVIIKLENTFHRSSNTHDLLSNSHGSRVQSPTTLIISIIWRHFHYARMNIFKVLIDISVRI